MNPVTIVSDAIHAWNKHYEKKDLNWPMIIYMGLVHLAAIIGVFMIPKCQKYTLLWAYLLWPITGLGITAGVHRLWAHRSYEAVLPLRIFLMLINSIANQGSIFHWSRDHRVHHKFSDTPTDPHNAARGFFFSHMGWLLVQKDKRVKEAGEKLDYFDLETDPVVIFQDTLDPWFALFMCFIFPAIVAMQWGENFWNGFWVAGALRYCFVLHCTWNVNSGAHFYGDHPYEPNSMPAENPIVAFVAIGEGWHNWHHKYPYDYATSEFGLESQFNPTKIFLDVCGLLGLAKNFKRGTGAWHRLRDARDKANSAKAPLKSAAQHQD